MNNLTLLIKPASSGCNLRCRYCFYADVSNNREIKNYGIMSSDTMHTLIEKAFSIKPNSINFAFQGGEPTLAGLDFFKAFVKKVKSENINNIKISYALQTNGTLIDEDFCKFFFQEKFLIGLSLDGDKSLNDINRVDASGKGVFNKIIKTAGMFNKYKIEFNILSVVTNNNARYAQKLYNFYKANGFKYLQFIPCIDDFGSSVQTLSVKRYTDFLNTIFEFWYNDIKKGEYISIRNFDNYISIIKGYGAESCAMGGRCGYYYVVESDGSLYPCDFYCIDKYKLGTVYDKTVFNMTEKHKSFIAESDNLEPSCKECRYYPICRGGCKRDREPAKTKNKYCKAYYSFFENNIKKLYEIAKYIK